MTASTIRLTVYADTYSEIIDKAEVELCRFLGVDSVQEAGCLYEMIIRPTDPDDYASDASSFMAEVIARVKK
jgi:hypothetical protein